MKALIMMLHNNDKNTYHPIIYFESPLPGGNTKIIRYKSKGHHTNGFANRADALNEAHDNISNKLHDMGYIVSKEIDNDIEWDGSGAPADVQIRSI